MNVHHVEIKRIFAAPIELVFDAWSNPEQMKKWYSPEGMTTPNVETNFSVGGEYSVTMAYENTSTVTVRGFYKEIVRPTKLIFTWKWDHDNLETEVTLLLRSISEKQTELTLIHAGFKAKESAEDLQKEITLNDHRNGWSTALIKLENYVKLVK